MDTNEVLDWMIDQKNDHSIEEIDRQTLFKYIDTKEFLAVVFCKYKVSNNALKRLELTESSF